MGVKVNDRNGLSIDLMESPERGQSDAMVSTQA